MSRLRRGVRGLSADSTTDLGVQVRSCGSGGQCCGLAEQLRVNIGDPDHMARALFPEGAAATSISMG